MTLSERPQLIAISDENGVERLARDLLDHERSYPIVCLTSRQREDQPALDAAAVAAMLGDRARLCFLPDGPLTRRLATLLPPKLAVFGGAARIWWPGLDERSDPYDHPLIQDRYRVYGELVLERLQAAWERGAPIASQSVYDQERLIALRDRDEARERADRLAAKVYTVERERDTYRTRALAAEARLRQRPTPAEKVSPQPHVLDPDAELRVEIAREWTLAFPRGDRDRHPMAPYRFGADFIDDACALATEHRKRLPWVCAMILTGTAQDLAGLKLHPLRQGPGGDDPQRVRTDGAKAWRCALKVHTPGAPQLHFWSLLDGSFEFATVGHHDRFTA